MSSQNSVPEDPLSVINQRHVVKSLPAKLFAVPIKSKSSTSKGSFTKVTPSKSSPSMINGIAVAFMRDLPIQPTETQRKLFKLGKEIAQFCASKFSCETFVGSTNDFLPWFLRVLGMSVGRRVFNKQQLNNWELQFNNAFDVVVKQEENEKVANDGDILTVDKKGEKVSESMVKIATNVDLCEFVQGFCSVFPDCTTKHNRAIAELLLDDTAQEADSVNVCVWSTMFEVLQLFCPAHVWPCVRELEDDESLEVLQAKKLTSVPAVGSVQFGQPSRRGIMAFMQDADPSVLLTVKAETKAYFVTRSCEHTLATVYFDPKLEGNAAEICSSLSKSAQEIKVTFIGVFATQNVQFSQANVLLSVPNSADVVRLISHENRTLAAGGKTPPKSNKADEDETKSEKVTPAKRSSEEEQDRGEKRPKHRDVRMLEIPQDPVVRVTETRSPSTSGVSVQLDSKQSKTEQQQEEPSDEMKSLLPIRVLGAAPDIAELVTRLRIHASGSGLADQAEEAVQRNQWHPETKGKLFTFLRPPVDKPRSFMTAVLEYRNLMLEYLTIVHRTGVPPSIEEASDNVNAAQERRTSYIDASRLKMGAEGSQFNFGAYRDQIEKLKKAEKMQKEELERATRYWKEIPAEMKNLTFEMQSLLENK